jgi:hypothetical protein
MKLSPRSRRTTSSLSESLHQRLNMYALAASAAGVSLLALGQPAEAKIVYTRCHVKLTPVPVSIYPPYGGLRVYNLDLNHDGIADFRLVNWWYNRYGHLRIFPMPPPAARGTNEIYGPRYNGWAAALSAGVSVGPGGAFRKSNNSMVYVWAGSGGGTWMSGSWFDVTNGYLGLKFFIDGKAHYGWARLNVLGKGHVAIQATLTGYAYETEPNKPIVTGRTKGSDDTDSVEPLDPTTLSAPSPQAATLGLLALGAPGLPIWRRKKESVAAAQ